MAIQAMDRNVNGHHFGRGSKAFYCIADYDINNNVITSSSYNSCVGLAIYRNGNPNRGLLAHFWASDAHNTAARINAFKEDVLGILGDWGQIENDDRITIWDGLKPDNQLAKERMKVFPNLFNVDPDLVTIGRAIKGNATLNLENGTMTLDV